MTRDSFDQTFQPPRASDGATCGSRRGFSIDDYRIGGSQYERPEQPQASRPDYVISNGVLYFGRIAQERGGPQHFDRDGSIVDPRNENQRPSDQTVLPERHYRGVIPKADRHDLTKRALELAGVSPTEKHIADVNKIVQRESGWDPNVTNKSDINARRGHPSTGLMQTIPSTFKANAIPGYNTNINDPLSNLIAGIRYAHFDPKYRNRGGLDYVASRPGGY